MCCSREKQLLPSDKLTITRVVGSACHARGFVQTAELDARLSRQAEAGEGLTALMRTPLEHNIDHSVQLVLATEHATICSRDIAGGLFPAARVHAVLVANVHHTILNVVLAVQPSLFSWTGPIEMTRS